MKSVKLVLLKRVSQSQIQITSTCLPHVSLKRLRRHLDLLKQRAIQHGRSRTLLTAAPRQRHLIAVVMASQAARDLERVADLAAVPAARQARVLLVVLAGELDDLGLLDQHGRLPRELVPLRLDVAQLGHVKAENVARLRLVQGRVVERHVDAGPEGVVDGAHAVRGQEEDAVVVLEDAEEDRDERVALHVLLGTLRQEDVGLVEQQDAVPHVRQPENIGQGPLHFGRRQAQVTAGDDKQGLLVLHGHSLGSSCLAHTRNSVQENNETPTFTLNQILTRTLCGDVNVLALDGLLLEMRAHEATDDVLVVLQDAQVLEDALLAADRLQGVDVDRHKAALAQNIGKHALGQENKILLAEVRRLRKLDVAAAAV